MVVPVYMKPSTSILKNVVMTIDDDYNLFDDKLTARISKMSISLSDNIANHLGTQK